MEIRYGLGEAHQHRGYDRSRRAGIGTGVKAVRVSGIRKKYHHLAETMKPDAKRTGIRFLCLFICEKMLKLFHKRMDVFKIPVDRSKPYIRYLVGILEFF